MAVDRSKLVENAKKMSRVMSKGEVISNKKRKAVIIDPPQDDGHGTVRLQVELTDKVTGQKIEVNNPIYIVNPPGSLYPKHKPSPGKKPPTTGKITEPKEILQEIILSLKD